MNDTLGQNNVTKDSMNTLGQNNVTKNSMNEALLFLSIETRYKLA